MMTRARPAAQTRCICRLCSDNRSRLQEWSPAGGWQLPPWHVLPGCAHCPTCQIARAYFHSFGVL